MSKTNLIAGYHLFGGKGDVWNNTAHICKDGFNPDTLCGKPMLSTNWVQIGGVTEAGCPECIKLFDEIIENLPNYPVIGYKSINNLPPE